MKAAIPRHLSKEMKSLWREVAGRYEMGPEHIHTLRLACESYDRAQACREQIERDGLVVDGGPHPLAAVSDRAIGTFIRALKELGLYDDKGGQEKPSTSELATRAARARWQQYRKGETA